jgi:hypothetical protein
MAEDDRRKASLVLAYGGWLSSGVIVMLRAVEVVPTAWGSTALLTIGVAIAASLARSRMRLTDTIVGVFEAGVRTADEERQALRREVQAVRNLVAKPRTPEEEEEIVATYAPDTEKTEPV